MLHFLAEVTMFKTMSLKAAANPMIIAGKCATNDVAIDRTFIVSHVTERKAVFRLQLQHLFKGTHGHHLQGYQFYGWELGGTTTPIRHPSSQSKSDLLCTHASIFVQHLG